MFFYWHPVYGSLFLHPLVCHLKTKHYPLLHNIFSNPYPKIKKSVNFKNKDKGISSGKLRINIIKMIKSVTA